MWPDYDLVSVKSAYRVETGVATDEEGCVEEELPQDAMNTVRIHPNPYTKESSAFQEESNLLICSSKKVGGPARI